MIQPSKRIDSHDLGQARISRICDMDRFALPLSFLLPDAQAEVLTPFTDTLAPWHVDLAQGTILLGIHSLLVQTDGLNILIDTCIGACKDRPARPEWHQRRADGYLQALSAAGLQPDDIDLVFCTHLHADHVGWNTRLLDGRWVPTFPRARYVIARHELDYATHAHAAAPGAQNHGAFADSVLPVIEAGQVEVVDDGIDLRPAMTIVPLHGHTPGQVGLSLALPDRRILFCADAIHSPVQVHFPDWSSRFCHDPVMAAATRRTLLDEAAEQDLLLFPGHLRGALGLTVTRRGDAYRPVPFLGKDGP